jgi:hypothetical protein
LSILILNRNAPYPFESWLEELDEDQVILTTQKRAKNITASYVEGFSNYEENGCIEVRAIELDQKFNFNTLIATSEFDIYRAAKIREYLGINGQGIESAMAFRDKVVMKNILHEKGIEVPPFKQIDTSTDIYEFVSKHNFPIVVKPRDGSGSEEVKVLDTYEDLMKYLQFNNMKNYEVEKFIEGDMYHIDGLVINGEIKFLWPSKYINGCLSHQEGNYNASYLLAENVPIFNRLIQLTMDILMALPTPDNTAFHAEIFHTLDDRLVFCEIASRRGGGYIAETIEHAFGIGLTKLTVQSQCGIKVNLPKARNKPRVMCGFLLIPAKSGKLKKIPNSSEENWVVKQEILANPGDIFNSSKSSLDTIASFLIEGKSEKEVQERIKFIVEWFNSNTEWI